MKLDERDGQILQHIVTYCHQIEDVIKFFGCDEMKFMNNHIYRSALSMNIQQIGELAVHLSEKFKQEHSEVPWKNIIGMRNRFAHDYQSMDLEIIWHTAIKRIPELLDLCQDFLRTGGVPVPTKSSVCISKPGYSR